MQLKHKIYIGCLAFAALAFAARSCSAPAVAAEEPTEISDGRDVLDDTRYSAIGIGDIADIIQFILEVNDGEMPPAVGDSDYWIRKYAEKAAERAAEDTIADAKTIYTAPNYEPYTINDSYSLIGKRRINYPYNGWYEIQYCYIYVNKNVDSQTPQQFGNYTIAPNTILVVRQTSFDGVKAFSVPIAENGLALQMNSAPSGVSLSIKLNGNNDNTFIYDDETGRQTVGFRHYGNDFSPLRLNFINNSTNTIVDNFLIDYYSNNQADYNTYLGGQRALNNFESFIGTGYDYNNSVGIMGGSPRPFYVTTAYFNTSGYDEDDASLNRINTYFNIDPDNIDPSKPPAYVMPQNNPLSSGSTINNNTVNNYNDYGVTMLDGELHLDPDILAGALGGLITPDFQGVLDGTFNAQPEIGLGFDTPLILDLPQLVTDYINSIIVYPPIPEWTAPTFGAVNTEPLVSYTYPTLPTETVPQNVIDDIGTVTHIGFDILDLLGITNILIAVAVIGIFGYVLLK